MTTTVIDDDRAADDRVPVKLLDPMPESRRMIDARFRRDGVTCLRFHRGDFFRYAGGRFIPMADPDLRATVVRWLDRRFSGIKTSAVTNMVECVKAETIVASDRHRPCWLGDENEARDWIAVKNGLLDLEAAVAGKPDALRGHTAEWFSEVCLPYRYDPAADCPFWLRVLDRNTGGDAEMQAILQEFSGYCLAPDTSQQYFLLLDGDGGTGKSSVLAAVHALLGRENVSAVPLERFGDRFALFGMLGKLANIAAEIGDLDKSAEGYLKSLTSGDAVTFERKHRDPVKALPTARLIFATNSRPRFADRSDGVWRRLILLPFTAAIPADERTVGLDKPHWWEQSGEMPGILNWAIAGLRRLRTQGRFTVSPISRAAAAEYRAESNPAAAFLAEHYRSDAECCQPKAEVYAAYKVWCETAGHKPLTDVLFGKEVFRTFPGVTADRRRIGQGDRVKVYAGLTRGSAS